MFLLRYSMVLVILTATLLAVPAQSQAADQESASIKGKVTLDGQPLANARVIFHLKDGQFVGAKTAEDGSYKVDLVPVGKHKITVEVGFNGKVIIPPKYADEERSALVFELKKGANICDLNLASK
jgi:hypothetical protein